jgi:glycosyltransferase involved in cell wall biosynthesis
MNGSTIVIDARMIDASGIGVYIKALIEPLSIKFNLILLGDPTKLTAYQSLASIIPFTTAIYSIAEQLQFANLIPSCDIFWSPHYNVPIFPTKAKIRVVTVHDVSHLALQKHLNLKQKLYAKYVMGRAVKLSKNVITVSDFSKDEIVKYTCCSPEKITVIHNGVKQANAIKDIQPLKMKYILPDQYILFVGNVKPHKNLTLFLKAYLLLSADLQSKFKIVIVGKKNGFIIADETLMTWINSHEILSKNVIFTGFVADEDMDAIYFNASLFVFPSIYEGFGLPPLEAMLNNCPTLVSDIKPHVEVCGDAAFYFDPFNEVEMSKYMADILTNPRVSNQLRMKGKERVKLFDWKIAAEKHIELFSQIIMTE